MARENGKYGSHDGFAAELAPERRMEVPVKAGAAGRDPEFFDVSSGVPAMDALHHAFFDGLDRLSIASDKEFPVCFGRFVAQVERTFRQEEDWMESVDVSDLLAHREQHARVLSALHNVHMRVADGDLKLGREVVDQLLPQWFALHMSTMDSALARAMQSSQRRHDAGAEKVLLN